MTEQALSDLTQSLERLRASNRRLAMLVVLFGAVACAALGVAWRSWLRAGEHEIPADRILTVRGLVVVDDHGIERVRLGAPLPDPLILGRRLKRKGSISGVMMSDADGSERSGYGTGDEYSTAVFTLDSTGDQQVLFMVDPSGPAQLSLFDDEFKHS